MLSRVLCTNIKALTPQPHVQYKNLSNCTYYGKGRRESDIMNSDTTRKQPKPDEMHEKYRGYKKVISLKNQCLHFNDILR